MGGFGGSGLAGAASADGEAFEVEGDDEGFGFEVIEVDVGGVADAGGAGSVDAGLLDGREEGLFEAVAQGGEGWGWAVGSGRASLDTHVSEARRWGTRIWWRFGGEPGVGEFGGFAEAYDSGYVFGSGAALALVGASVEERGEADVAADEEDAGALGGVHLVAGDAEEVYVLEFAGGAEVEGELAGGLDCVGVEEGSGGVGDGGEFGDGLDDAGLVVGVA